MERTFVFHMCEIRRLLSLSSQLRCQNTIKKEKKEKTIGDALKLLSLFYTNKIKVKKTKTKTKTRQNISIWIRTAGASCPFCVYTRSKFLLTFLSVGQAWPFLVIVLHCVYIPKFYFPERMYIHTDLERAVLPVGVCNGPPNIASQSVCVAANARV